MSELLSQEQLDQLLASGGFSTGSGDSNSGGQPSTDGDYTAVEKTFQVFSGELSSVLTTVLNRKVDSELRLCAKADFTGLKSLGTAMLCIEVPFKTGLSGEMFLCLKKSDVAVLADLMMMGEGNVQYSREHDDAILELSNQICSSFALELSGEIGFQVTVSPAKMTSNTLDQPPLPQAELDMVTIKLSLEGRPDSEIAILIPKSLSEKITQKSAPVGNDEKIDLDGDDFSQIDIGVNENTGGSSGHGKSVQHPKENIEMLLDVDLDVTIELGRSTLSIKRILELAPGSIIELDRMAGEPVDLRVNNKVVAKGEVVVIDENFGIRILSLISPEERIKSLA